MNSSKRVLLIALCLLTACLPTVPVSPVSPIVIPLEDVTPVPVPIAQRSLVSVHAGAEPLGLDDFLEATQPQVIYALNNSLMQSIRDHSPATLLVRRIQNDTWDRLPDCWYCGLTDPDWEAQARASARWEILGKLIYVPGHGYLNYIGFAGLSEQNYLAPLNEPVLGADTGDYALKARWLDAWTQEWLTIAHANGLHGSIYSFATGEPPLAAVPYLTGSACLAAQSGDIIDLHAYGVEQELMTSHSSGAFWFVRFHDALPIGCRPRMVISEASAGNGYDTGLSGGAWIADFLAYGQALRRYPYILGACAFQLDRRAESNIPQSVLEDLGERAAALDWSPIGAWSIHVPLVLN